MSYANSGTGRERIVAIGLVGLIQGGIIAALVSGLAVQFVATVADLPLRTYNVPNDPLPPPPDIKQPDTKPLEALSMPLTPPVAPKPLIVTEPRPSIDTTTDLTPKPLVDIVPMPIPLPSTTPTPMADMSRGASARGSVAEWFPRSEYPAAALRAGAEGRVSVMLTVSPSGRATSCEVMSGSGDASLDAATCRLALRNGRFEPARDVAGNKAVTQMRLPPIVWRIES